MPDRNLSPNPAAEQWAANLQADREGRDRPHPRVRAEPRDFDAWVERCRTARQPRTDGEARWIANMQADYLGEVLPYPEGTDALDGFEPPPTDAYAPTEAPRVEHVGRGASSPTASARARRGYGESAARMVESYEVVGVKLQAEADGRDFATVTHGPGANLPDRPAVLHRGFAAAIVEASTVLTSNQKRLYRRYLELDRPRGYRSGGCFAKVETLARRLGMSPGSVKRDRRTLGQYGMLHRTAEGVSPVRWFPSLPPWVVGIPPETVKAGKPTDAWIMAQALKLDTVLSAQVREAKAHNERKRGASKQAGTICTPESDKLYPCPAPIHAAPACQG